jgi:hypothetical protein
VYCTHFYLGAVYMVYTHYPPDTTLPHVYMRTIYIPGTVSPPTRMALCMYEIVIVKHAFICLKAGNEKLYPWRPRQTVYMAYSYPQ